MAGGGAIPIPEMVQYPSRDAVLTFITDKWSERFKLQDRALEWLFLSSPNTDPVKVLLKVAALNDFYGTQIKDTYTVAAHIVSLAGFDQRLLDEDLEVVNDMATVNFSRGPVRLYSFASKYCAHHSRQAFPIYDYYVGEMLLYYREQKRITFEKDDLRNYPKFVGAFRQFQSAYGLSGLTVQQIDCFLWLTGRAFRPKKYPNRVRTKPRFEP